MDRGWFDGQVRKRARLEETPRLRSGSASRRRRSTIGTGIPLTMLTEEQRIALVKRKYPGFRENCILKFSELFAAKPWISEDRHIRPSKEIIVIEASKRMNDKDLFPQYTSPIDKTESSSSSIKHSMMIRSHSPSIEDQDTVS
jgi:hypothetical protein